MRWLSGEPRRLVALRVALEVLVALLALGSAGLLGPGFLVAATLRAWLAFRADPSTQRWESSVAAVLAMALASAGEIWLHEAVVRGGIGSVWWTLPWLIAAYALLMRPSAGLAFVASWLVWPFYRDVPLFCWGVPLLSVVLALRDRRWRLPLTWAVAGMAVQLACRAIAFDHEALGPAGTLSNHASAWVQATQLDLAMLITMVIAGRAMLAERTWGVLAMIGMASLYAMQPAPHRVPRLHVPNGPIHPLDAGQAHLFAIIAIVLALTWALPLHRALRDR